MSSLLRRTGHHGSQFSALSMWLSGSLLPFLKCVIQVIHGPINKMCRFCWHHVKENLNGKCPACRKPYDPENYSFIPPDPEEYVLLWLLLCSLVKIFLPICRIAKMVSQKKKERKKKKEKAQTETSKSIDVVASRKNLSNVRVIQRNLVYVTNLALSVAKEEVRLSFRNSYYLHCPRFSGNMNTLGNMERFKKS